MNFLLFVCLSILYEECVYISKPVNPSIIHPLFLLQVITDCLPLSGWKYGGWPIFPCVVNKVDGDFRFAGLPLQIWANSQRKTIPNELEFFYE